MEITNEECPVEVFYLDFGFSSDEPYKGTAIAVLGGGWVRVWRESDGPHDADGCYQGYLMPQNTVARVDDGWPEEWKDL